MLRKIIVALCVLAFSFGSVFAGGVSLKHSQSLLENFKSGEEYVLYIDNFLEGVDDIRLQEIYDRARVAYFDRGLHNEVGEEISAILDYLYVKTVYELNPEMYERDVQATDTTFTYPLEVLKDDLPEDIEIIKSGDTISVHYEGRFEDGEVFDSSYERGETLNFEAGAGWMISGFDVAVIGMKAGDKKTVTLSPSEAYGELGPHNSHPLAGKTLIFDIEIIEIK